MANTLATIAAIIMPKRRWGQFSLGTMLLVVAAICIWLADYVRPVRRLERQLLRDPDTVERIIAAQRLGNMGPEARAATTSLLRAMSDGSSEVRARAAWAISRVSGRPEVLLPFLVDREDDVKYAAAEGILWDGGDPVQLFSTLIANSWLTGKGSSVNKSALCSCLSPNQAAIVLPLFLDSLGSDEAAARDQAADCLQRLSVPAPTAVPVLVERLDHQRAEVRKAAAEQLLLLSRSRAARQAIPALRARLHDPDSSASVAIAAALGAIDPDDKEFLGILEQALRSGSTDLVVAVASYLVRLGPAAAGVSDDLVAGFCDPRVCEAPYYGYISVWTPALKRLGPPAVSAVDRALKQALTARNKWRELPDSGRAELHSIGLAITTILRWALMHLRQEAYCLTDAGHVAYDLQTLRLAIIKILQSILENVVILFMPETRRETIVCLADIGQPTLAVRTLVAALDEPLDSACFRDDAIRALGRIGKDANSAVIHLLPLLSSNNSALRRLVLKALAGIGVYDEVSRARLRPFLTSGDRYERKDAARALALSREPAGDIVPVLLDLATDPYFHGSPDIYAELVASIASIGPSAVPELIATLQSPEARMRCVAADAIGGIGPAARTSMPFLIDILADPPSRDAAAEALGHIGPEAHVVVPKLLRLLEALRHRGESKHFVPILNALGGIGAGARDGLSEVLSIADSNDPRIRHAAVMALARIEPTHPSLIPRLRRLLAEWERNGARRYCEGEYCMPHEGLAQIADAVWQLGPAAAELAPDLRRIAAAPLLHPDIRCYATFALASCVSQRDHPLWLLEMLSLRDLDSEYSVNLAESLLARVQDSPAASHK